jgi:hypothetical protein
MNDDVIKIVNANAEAVGERERAEGVKARRRSEAAYRNYVKAVMGRLMFYFGFEAIMAVLVFADWIAPLLGFLIMLVTLFFMGVYVGKNYRVFLPQNY